MKRRAALAAFLGAAVVAQLTVRLKADPTHANPGEQQPPAAQSVWDGVYTLAQAKRGALKSGLCTSCHGDSFLGGSAPELAGDAFLSRWEGRSVADLFDLIRLTMPDDDPGALAREQYADLIAYILAVNKFPEGRTEIGTAVDPLKTIRILATKP